MCKYTVCRYYCRIEAINFNKIFNIQHYRKVQKALIKIIILVSAFY